MTRPPLRIVVQLEALSVKSSRHARPNAERRERIGVSCSAEGAIEIVDQGDLVTAPASRPFFPVGRDQ